MIDEDYRDHEDDRPETRRFAAFLADDRYAEVVCSIERDAGDYYQPATVEYTPIQLGIEDEDFTAPFTAEQEKIIEYVMERERSMTHEAETDRLNDAVQDALGRVVAAIESYDHTEVRSEIWPHRRDHLVAMCRDLKRAYDERAARRERDA